MKTAFAVAALVSSIGLAYPALATTDGRYAPSAQAETRITRLAGDSRIANPPSVLESLLNGAETTAVIVTLKPTPKAKYLAEISRPATRQPLDFEDANGTVFYNLEDLTIRKALHETVTETVAQTVGAMDIPGMTVTRQFSYQFGFAATVTAEALEAVLAHPDVLRVEKDIEVYPQLRQGIPLMNATVPRTSYTGRGIAIAIVDSGIDTRHPKLGNGGNPVFNGKVIGGRDTWDNDNDPRPGREEKGGSHGTEVAGIAAGDLGDEGDYIGGVAPDAKLYAIKISSKRDGKMSLSAGIKGWEWVIEHQYDNPSYPILIMNNSWGSNTGYSSVCDGDSQGMAQVARNAVSAGITILVASGNDGRCGSLALPACISYVNSVGALYDANIGPQMGWCVSGDACSVTKKSTPYCRSGWQVDDPFTAPKKVTAYSNSASFMTLFAPSHNAYTTTIVGSIDDDRVTDYAATFGGTSAASPYAAGAAAVLQEAAKSKLGRYLTPAEVKQYLTTTGELITDTKVAVTKPLINLQAAVSALPGVSQPALNVHVQGTGSGTVSSVPSGIDCGSTCTARYATGTGVTLTATPSAQSAFSGWAGACSGTGACTVTMSQDKEVWATFTRTDSPTTSTLKVTLQGTGSGTVSSVPSGIDCGSICTARYDNGTSVTLTAKPSALSVFSGWVGACSGTGTCTVTMSQDRQVWATYTFVGSTISSATAPAAAIGASAD